jgi:hypothetical protein
MALAVRLHSVIGTGSEVNYEKLLRQTLKVPFAAVLAQTSA